MRTVRHLLNAHADPGIASTTGNAVHHALWGSLQDAEQVLVLLVPTCTAPSSRLSTVRAPCALISGWAFQDPEKPTLLVGLLEPDPECINVGNTGNMLEHRAAIDNNTPLQVTKW